MANSNLSETGQNAPNAQMPQATALPEILPNPEGGAAGLSIARVAGKGLINLRADDNIKARLETLFGTALPSQPNKMAAIGTRRALWLGPDETLLMIEEAQVAEFMLSGKSDAGRCPLCGHTAIRCAGDFPARRRTAAGCAGQGMFAGFASRQF